MNLQLFFILFIVFFSCTPASVAQTGRRVQGLVKDSTKSPMQAASIQLFVPGSKDTAQLISDKKGHFTFYPVDASHFIVSVSAAGFKIWQKEYRFAETNVNIQLDDITLRPIFRVLKEVIVLSPSVTIREDTIEYKANSFMVRPDAMVEDLLKILPGIQVSRNGLVTAQGKAVFKIKVNGKDFFGNDVKMATRELPAGVIDKIQVIDDYGDEAAVSGIKTGIPAKVINLQFKKNNNEGIFGKATAGYGTSNTYQAKLSTNYFTERSQLSLFANSNNINNGYENKNSSSSGINGLMPAGGAMSSGLMGAGSGNSAFGQPGNGLPDGITTSHDAGLNYRIDFGKRNSFYGSYSLGNRNTEGSMELYQQSFYSEGNFINNQHNEYTNSGTNHQAYLNLEWYPDSLSYIKISPQLFFDNSTSNRGSNFEYLRSEGIKTSEGYLNDTGKTKTPDIGLNLFYNRRFGKYGRNLSISLTQSISRSKMKSHIQGLTRIFETSNIYQDSTQYQQILQNSKINNYSVNLSYSEPLKKDIYLDFTYFHNFSESDNDRKVYYPVTGLNDDSLVTNLSNQFTNRFISDRIGINFRTLKKKYTYSIGISVLPLNSKNYSEEKDTANAPHTTINIAPLARFTFNFSRSKSLGFTYSGNSRQPGFSQLQPVRDISNPQYQKEGNPSLRPEFIHNLSLSFNSFNLQSGSSLFASMAFNTTQNKIVSNTILLDTAGAQLNRPENISGNYNVSGFYTYTKPWLTNRYTFIANGFLNYNHSALLVNSNRVTPGNWLISQGLEVKYNDNKWLELSIAGSYSVSANRNLFTGQNKFVYTSWTISNNLSMYLPGNLTIKYDFEKIINQGLNASFNNNIQLLNITAEKKLSKKKNIYAGITGFNVLNQNASLTRQVYGNAVIDTRSLQLSRYFLFSIIYRWNRFG